ncbi:MAG TPA: response regulator transcription factor [Cerasibacillus sp.]|uniref:helix-turn-helix transcriptional regulator n=1 Tax=Cerasibacillus sp. TaxID=2498711 RepID=UPI002F4134F8
MYHIAMITNILVSAKGIANILQEEIEGCTFHVFSGAFLKQSEEVYDLVIVDEPLLKNVIEYYDNCSNVAVNMYNPSQARLEELFRLKLQGYLYTEMEINEVINAIRMMLEKRTYVHPEWSEMLLQVYQSKVLNQTERPNGLLTEQEWNVLEQLVLGHKNCTIAKNLYISRNTVTNHVSSIIRKLRVQDRTGAALLAVKKGWISL